MIRNVAIAISILIIIAIIVYISFLIENGAAGLGWFFFVSAIFTLVQILFRKYFDNTTGGKL